MLDKWTGEVVGTMHIYGVSNIELAKKMGVTKGYVSALLNCKKRPDGAEFKVRTALHEVLQEREDAEAEAY